MKKIIVFLTLTCTIFSTAHAGLMIHGTRFIFPASEKNISIQLTNEGNTPLLAEAWIAESQDKSAPEDQKVPFILTPPMARMEAKAGQLLRVTKMPASLPNDKESLFWLNVLEIPPRNTKLKNQLQIAIHSQMKIIYRPVAVPDDIESAVKKLVWHVTPQGVKVKNSTPHVISLTGLELNGRELMEKKSQSTLMPGDEVVYKASNVAKAKEITVYSVNDAGGELIVKSELK